MWIIKSKLKIHLSLFVRENSQCTTRNTNRMYNINKYEHFGIYRYFSKLICFLRLGRSWQKNKIMVKNKTQSSVCLEAIRGTLVWNEAVYSNGNIPHRRWWASRACPACSGLSVSLHKMCQILQSVFYWPNGHCRIYFTHINRQDSRISNEEAIWIMYITLPFSSTIKQ